MPVFNVVSAHIFCIESVSLHCYVVRPYDRPLELARGKSRQSLPEYLPSDFHKRKAITADNFNTDVTSIHSTQVSTPVASGSRAIHTSTPVASSSGQASSPASCSSDGLDVAEKVILRLLGGEGISWFDQRHLIEECDSCKRYFLGNYLRARTYRQRSDYSILGS